MHCHFFDHHSRWKVVEDDEGVVEEIDPEEDTIGVSNLALGVDLYLPNKLFSCCKASPVESPMEAVWVSSRYDTKVSSHLATSAFHFAHIKMGLVQILQC